LFWQRIISALIGIPVIILLIYFGGLPLLLSIVVLALIGIYELIKIFSRMKLQVPQILLYGSAFLYPLLAYFAPDGKEDLFYYYLLPCVHWHC
jgi:phosphatidate cytidylyltransferase